MTTQQKPKHPYIKFLTTWKTLVDGNLVEDPKEIYFDVSIVQNATEETVNNLRRKGWKVLEFGNFPDKANYKDLANYLTNMTEVGYQIKEAEMRAKIMAELNSQGIMPEAKPRAKREAKQLDQVESSINE